VFACRFSSFPAPRRDAALALMVLGPAVFATWVFAAAFLTAAGPAAAALSAGGRAPGLDSPALRPDGQERLPGVVIVKFAGPLGPGAEKAASLSAPFRTGSAVLDALCRHYQVERFEPVAPPRTTSRKTLPLSPVAPHEAGPVDLSRLYVLHFGGGADPLQVARDFAARPEVEYAEPQFVYPLAAIANDPLYPTEQSAYFTRMAFPAAHDNTRGSDGDVVVALVDGGSEWQHPDLAPNVWTNPGESLNGVDDDGNGFVDDLHGWNFSNGTSDPTGLPQTPSSAGHGTHVAGIACAVSNNAIGVAGATWNARFMPVCVAHPTVDNAIAFGYQGILYAVNSGADVVSCSWGGQGNPSYFEREVIEYARQHGVVVVAAAGNNASSADFYPAGYAHVLAVANVNNTDQKSASSNYGPWVDVAAQGTSIHSTYRNGSYLDLSGTSMAAPHAAAACALVKTKWPTALAEQVRERVRVTCDNIDALNPGYGGQLGYGRINAAQALSKVTPALRILEVAYDTPDGDAIIEPTETVAVHVTVINWLDPATNLQFTLGENSSYATVPVNSDAVASLGTLEQTVLDFSVRFTAAAPVNHLATCTLNITSGSPAYTDADRFDLRVLPIIATHDANQVVTTVTSVGKLGFGEKSGGNGKDGVGFLYAGSPNLLFEGALLVGTGQATISDAARGATASATEDDFVTATNGTPSLTTAHPLFDQFVVATCTDAGATTPLGLRLRQESWEISYQPYDDFVVLRYAIQNQSAQTLQNLRVGWFLDWDLDGATYETNHTGYDATRGLGYVWDDGTGPDVYVGVVTLTPPGTTAYRGIWNDEADPNNPSWGIYDGFSDAEKWEALTAGIVQAEAGPADISQLLATGPFTIAPGDSIVVGFAFVGGSSLADLQQNTDVALSAWATPTDTGPTLAPRRLWLEQNSPNPFNPATRIAFDLPNAGDVELGVYAVNGRRVRTLLHEHREAGRYEVSWDGRDSGGRRAASGVYFYRLTAAGRSITRKMQLLQ